MNLLKTNCDRTANALISAYEAKQRIMDYVKPVQGREKINIRSALNRILDEDIISRINVPPCDNSAMDGYAIRSSDVPESGISTLHMIGTAFAGKPFDGQVDQGQCVRIMTGAKMPAGADAVVMQEDVQTKDDSITLTHHYKSGENVRYAGEDMRVGQTVLTTGTRITPAEIGLLASLGIPEVMVRRNLRVAFFSTGDELKSVGETLGDGDIYDSNRYTLFGMLKRLGVDLIDMGVIRDRQDDVRQVFIEASGIADAIITSGGVSVGEADYVKSTLDELGEMHFWRVAMKPGKPLAIGKLGNAFFFGLPGNPVSVMATFYQFVQPALKRMLGEKDGLELILSVPCMTRLAKQPGRLEYQRGILSHDPEGQLIVHSTGGQGSHVLTSMSRANCFIILPAESAGVEEGNLVQVQPFYGIT